MKSEFYQEKPFWNHALQEQPEVQTLEQRPDIFKRDFIPFESSRDSEAYEKFAVNSKKIRKFKNQNFSRGRPEREESPKYDNQIQNGRQCLQIPGQQTVPINPQINPQYQETRPFLGRDITELIDAKQKKLPIFNRVKVILDSIGSEQVVVISGDTGCGKSTQVPKYIYLQARSQGRRVKIICTQPRRMAALNLAKRVAIELSESLGGIVGYQISLDSRQNDRTAILYVTNGIFLQALIHDQNIFSEVTHVILDEVHERDIDSDFTMIAMKHLLRGNPQLKLILMSATINTQLFVNYFSKDEIQNCHIKEYNYELNANSKKWEKLSNWEDYDPKVAALTREGIEEEVPPWTSFKVKRENDHSNPYGSSRRYRAPPAPTWNNTTSMSMTHPPAISRSPSTTTRT